VVGSSTIMPKYVPSVPPESGNDLRTLSTAITLLSSKWDNNPPTPEDRKRVQAAIEAAIRLDPSGEEVMSMARGD
jgi:hypothetical protein